MTKKNILQTLLTIYLISSYSSGYADDLLTVFDLAQRNDAVIRAATADYQASQQVPSQSRAALLPQLSGDVRSSQTETTNRTINGVANPDEDTESNSWSLNLRQTLYDHASWQRLWSANATAAAAEAQYRAAEQDLILRVAETYFNVLAAEDNLEFAEAERKAVGQQLEQAKQRFDVGLIAITDVKESQAQYDQAVASEIQAQNTLSAAREALWTLTNHTLAKLERVSDKLPLVTPDPQDKQQWVDKALNENLSLLAAKNTLDAADHNVDAQRAGHYPTLSLTASVGSGDNEVLVPSAFQTEGDSETIGVELSIPIYSGGGVSARTREAVYRRDSARETHEGTRRQVIQQTRNAYQNVVADISRVKALQQALISSQAAYEATEAGFEVGTRNSVEVLLSLRNTFAARRDYAQTRYDYLLDTLRLKQSTGSLSIEDLRAINRWLEP